MKKFLLFFFVIFISTVIAQKSLFHEGLYTAHDIRHQVARLYWYEESIEDGYFPPTWISSMGHGYGYPLFLFSYHLPWIIGIIFLFLGFSVLSTIKILFFLSFFLSGIFMYLLSKEIFKNQSSAIVAAILYQWTPYHFMITFVAASMGVAFAYAFLPLFLLGLYLIKEKKYFKGVITGGIGFSAIILSHLLSFVIIAPFIGIWVIWCLISKNKNEFIQKIFNMGLLGLTGILMSAFYLIPSIYYVSYTKFQNNPGFVDLYQRNLVDLGQIIYSPWGYGPVINNAKDGEISFQMGIAQLLSIIGIVGLFLVKRIKNTSVFWLVLVGFLISIFLMTDVSIFYWKIFTKYITIDFPFRNLLTLSLVGSLAGGILINSFSGKYKYLLIGILLIICFYTNRNHINVNLYTELPIENYLSTESTTNTFDEYLPVNASTQVFHKDYRFIDSKSVNVLKSSRDTHQIALDIVNPIATISAIGQFYFPGQTVFIDNQNTKFSSNKDGLIMLNIPEGNHQIVIRYIEPLIIRTSQLISLFTILFLVVLISMKYRNKWIFVKK